MFLCSLDIGGNDVNSDCIIDEERKAGDAGNLMPPPYGDRFQDRILMGFKQFTSSLSVPPEKLERGG